MTKEEFSTIWKLCYPETIPVSHQFRHAYPDRWFRVHNLPASKRYPENETELEIVLLRQNQIFSDLFGPDAPVLLVTGEFNWGNNRNSHIVNAEKIFKAYSFTRLDNIDLYKFDTEQYDEVDIFRPAFAQMVWYPHGHDNVLKAIAIDHVLAFFVSFEKKIIVAPYGGGIDFVLKDSLTKKYYKNKYKHWLSEREDGL